MVGGGGAAGGRRFLSCHLGGGPSWRIKVSDGRVTLEGAGPWGLSGISAVTSREAPSGCPLKGRKSHAGVAGRDVGVGVARPLGRGLQSERQNEGDSLCRPRLTRRGRCRKTGRECGQGCQGQRVT